MQSITRYALAAVALSVASVASAATYTFPSFVPSPTTFTSTNIRNFDLLSLGNAPVGSWLRGTVTVAWDGGNVTGNSAQWSNEARAGLSAGPRGGTASGPTGGTPLYGSTVAPTSGGLSSSAPTTLTWDFTFGTVYGGGTNPLFLNFGQTFYSTTTPTANANWNNVSVQLFDSLPPPLAPTGLITDIGTLGNTSNTYAVPDRTVTVSTTASNRVHYIKFTIPTGGVLSSLDQFLDIDTGSSPDSVIGLYRAFSPTSAVLEDSDDDDGPGPAGGGSALSYGDTSPARGPIAPDAIAGNGRDGLSLGAGTYYLAVAGYTSSYSFGSNYNVTGVSAAPASYTVNFRTNVPEPTTLGLLAGIAAVAGRRRRA